MLKLISACVFSLALAVELYLVASLLFDTVWINSTGLWIAVHVFASAITAITAALLINTISALALNKLTLFCFAIMLSIPFFGAAGLVGALFYGIYKANNQHQEQVYWHFTKNASLPFTAPIKRPLTSRDSRGFVEQLAYSSKHDDLYKKVLAARNIRNALSVGTLKSAIKHPDERIRLTAYQTLDRKITYLNREIQRLEKAASAQDSKDQSNTWLQIASNYWELLTLEKDEPVAREQLLNKATHAAMTSVRILPTNRNAHFTLGRISLIDNKARIANAAFERAMALGMPEEKVMPYIAEVAFVSNNYKKVQQSLASMDDAFKAYPPLKHVAQYWS